jgi:hypothetical protein
MALLIGDPIAPALVLLPLDDEEVDEPPVEVPPDGKCPCSSPRRSDALSSSFDGDELESLRCEDEPAPLAALELRERAKSSSLKPG